MKHVQEYSFCHCGQKPGLKAAFFFTNDLFNLVCVTEQGTYIPTTSWEGYYFHVNSQITAKNSLAQDKIMPQTMLKN